MKKLLILLLLTLLLAPRVLADEPVPVPAPTDRWGCCEWDSGSIGDGSRYAYYEMEVIMPPTTKAISLDTTYFNGSIHLKSWITNGATLHHSTITFGTSVYNSITEEWGSPTGTETFTFYEMGLHGGTGIPTLASSWEINAFDVFLWAPDHWTAGTESQLGKNYYKIKIVGDFYPAIPGIGAGFDLADYYITDGTINMNPLDIPSGYYEGLHLEHFYELFLLNYYSYGFLYLSEFTTSLSSLDSTITSEAPTGYVFDRWVLSNGEPFTRLNLTEDFYTEDIYGTKNVNLYATWKKASLVYDDDPTVVGNVPTFLADFIDDMGLDSMLGYFFFFMVTLFLLIGGLLFLFRKMETTAKSVILLLVSGIYFIFWVYMGALPVFVIMILSMFFIFVFLHALMKGNDASV